MTDSLRTPPLAARSHAIRDGAFCLLLAAAILTVYSPVGGFDFINYDDPQYVSDNALVKQGVTWSGVEWAFTTGALSNWHPLTWLAHMLDSQLFGVDAGAHHLVGAVLHTCNAVLLFLVLRRMTSRFWPSAFVAALFGLHPLNVESVAWVAERKNQLSALLWISTVGAYAAYARRPSFGAYACVISLFVLGLMAKPVLVTLPLVLLLLDYWPLARFRGGPVGLERGAAPGVPRRGARDLVLEKVPLLVLTVASCIVTWSTARHGGAMSMTAYSFQTRAVGTLVSYAAYIADVAFARDLAVLYPHPKAWPLWQVGAALALLTAVSLLALRFRRSRPYLVVGWLWFLITLLPTIGLVQVGLQWKADRYAYLPAVGLFIAVAFTAADVVEHRPRLGRAFVACGLALLGVVTWTTTRQLPVWRDSVALFSHAVAVTPDNAVAHYNLGDAFFQRGKWRDAAQHYGEAARIVPDYAAAHSNLALSLTRLGDFTGAEAHYLAATEIAPDVELFRLNFGALLLVRGDLDAAAEQFEAAIRAAPTNASGHAQLAAVRIGQHRIPEAERESGEAIRLDPDRADAHLVLGKVRLAQGQAEQAEHYFATVMRLDPNAAEAQLGLGGFYVRQGRSAEAIDHFRTALQLQPDLVEARDALARLNARDRDQDERGRTSGSQR